MFWRYRAIENLTDRGSFHRSVLFRLISPLLELIIQILWLHCGADLIASRHLVPPVEIFDYQETFFQA
jgi:hypothetical protein